jgi:hypothetical protein
MKGPDTHLKKNRDLYQSCTYGGSLEEIQKLTAEYEYSKEALEYAISVLENSVTSALENSISKEAISHINKIIDGKDLLRKIKNK